MEVIELEDSEVEEMTAKKKKKREKKKRSKGDVQVVEMTPGSSEIEVIEVSDTDTEDMEKTKKKRKNSDGSDLIIEESDLMISDENGDHIKSSKLHLISPGPRWEMKHKVEAVRNGILINQSNYTAEEILRIHNNFKNFMEINGYDKSENRDKIVYFMFRTKFPELRNDLAMQTLSKQVKNELNAKKFYLKLAEGLDDRTVKSVYDKARSILNFAISPPVVKTEEKGEEKLKESSSLNQYPDQDDNENLTIATEELSNENAALFIYFLKKQKYENEESINWDCVKDKFAARGSLNQYVHLWNKLKLECPEKSYSETVSWLYKVKMRSLIEMDKPMKRKFKKFLKEVIIAF